MLLLLNSNTRLEQQNAVQEAVLDRLGINAQQAKEQFGFLLEALNSGAPPHGGIAFGLDRITAMVSKTDSIRDVIAFPKTQRGQCLLTGAPAPLPAEALAELGLSSGSLSERSPQKIVDINRHAK